MARLFLFVALLMVALAGPNLSSGPAFAQGSETERAAPPSAWPSASQAPAASEPDRPRAAWPSRSGQDGAQQTAVPPDSGSGWWQMILSVQQDLYRQLTKAVTALRSGQILTDGSILIMLSFAYGIFHAVGPGHGKAVISSYVLANGTTVRRGIVLSFLAALMQAITAIAIMAVVAILLNAGGVEVKQVLRQFETASGALIALTGLWLLYTYMKRRFSGPAMAHAHASGHAHAGHDHHHHHHHHEADHGHGDNCGCGHAHMPRPEDVQRNWSLANAAAIVFSIGIRPCSGAIIVLGVALTQGLFLAGIVATFAMALGTAITVSILAVMAVGSRDLALRFAGSRWTTGIYDLAAVGGSLLVMLLGAGLFWSSLGPANPF